MRPVITLALACAGFAAAQAALAQTLRCGFVLIQPGDDARYVLEKCGAPTGWTAITLPGSASSVYVNVYQTRFTRADRWLYHRDFGQFAAVLAIGDDGRVSDIQFERFRD